MLGKSDQIFLGLVPAHVVCVAMVIEPVLVEHLCVLVNQQDVAWRIRQAVLAFQLVQRGKQFAVVFHSSYYLFE